MFLCQGVLGTPALARHRGCGRRVSAELLLAALTLRRPLRLLPLPAPLTLVTSTDGPKSLRYPSVFMPISSSYQFT